jgi:hypothetical protein
VPASLSAWCGPEEGKEGWHRSARRSARRGAARAKEEGGKKERKEKKEKRRDRKKKKKKEIGKREKKIKKNRKNVKGKENSFRVLGEFLGKFGGKEKRDFAEFSGFGRLRDFGTAVMARRTGRRDRGVREIPSAVADNGARVTGGGATTRVRAVPA